MYRRYGGWAAGLFALSAISDLNHASGSEQSTIRPDEGSAWRQEKPQDAPASRPARSDAERRSPGGKAVRGPFVSVQVNVDELGNNIVGDAANEPSMAIDPTNPNRIVIGWRQFDSIASNFREGGWAYSHDGGQSWTFPGVLEKGVFRSDPVLAADSLGRIHYSSLTVDNPTPGDYLCNLFTSINGGVSFGPPVDTFGGDKQWLAIDRTGGIGEGNMYVKWQSFFGCCGFDTFTRSVDGGATFQTPVAVPLGPTFGMIDVGPGGEVYFAGIEAISFQNYSTFVVVRSDDAQDPMATPTFPVATVVDLGGSMEIGEGPNPVGLLGQANVATDHSGGSTNGNVYLLCSVVPPGDDPLDVMFARSEDGGVNWSAPVRVNDDPTDNGGYQWFGTMSVAPGGRIDVVWNDTRNDPTVTFSELMYSFSTDAGQTWSPNTAVTPAFNHFLGYPNQQKLGDYYHGLSDAGGVNVAYAATFNGEQDVYFIRIAPDCNGNGLHDGDDIAEGRSLDGQMDGIPDECQVIPTVSQWGAINLSLMIVACGTIVFRQARAGVKKQSVQGC